MVLYVLTFGEKMRLTTLNCCCDQLKLLCNLWLRYMNVFIFPEVAFNIHSFIYMANQHTNAFDKYKHIYKQDNMAKHTIYKIICIKGIY